MATNPVNNLSDAERHLHQLEKDERHAKEELASHKRHREEWVRKQKEVEDELGKLDQKMHELEKVLTGFLTDRRKLEEQVKRIATDLKRQAANDNKEQGGRRAA